MSRMFMFPDYNELTAKDYQVGDLTNAPDGTQYIVTKRMLYPDGSVSGYTLKVVPTLSTVLEEFK